MLIGPHSATMRAEEPAKPLIKITLTPIPCEWGNEQIETITNEYNWGNINKIKYLTHKNFPTIRNGFVEIYFDEINLENIPDAFVLYNINVNIIKPEDKKKTPTCKQCDQEGHHSNQCPKPKQNNKYKKQILEELYEIQYISSEEETIDDENQPEINKPPTPSKPPSNKRPCRDEQKPNPTNRRPYNGPPTMDQQAAIDSNELKAKQQKQKELEEKEKLKKQNNLANKKNGDKS